MMYLAVFVGGALGSLVRELATPWLPAGGALTATFVVNVVACFVLGWLYAARHRLHPHALHLGAVGFCGGLSTFSSFAAEVSALAAAGRVPEAVLAPALEISVGLLAAALGERAGRRVHGAPP